jgi:hypothetical protein
MAAALKYPELNPVENVWQFIRDNWLSNVHRPAPLGTWILIIGRWYNPVIMNAR